MVLLQAPQPEEQGILRQIRSRFFGSRNSPPVGKRLGRQSSLNDGRFGGENSSTTFNYDNSSSQPGVSTSTTINIQSEQLRNAQLDECRSSSSQNFSSSQPAPEVLQSSSHRASRNNINSSASTGGAGSQRNNNATSKRRANSTTVSSHFEFRTKLNADALPFSSTFERFQFSSSTTAVGSNNVSQSQRSSSTKKSSTSTIKFDNNKQRNRFFAARRVVLSNYAKLRDAHLQLQELQNQAEESEAISQIQQSEETRQGNETQEGQGIERQQLLAIDFPADDADRLLLNDEYYDAIDSFLLPAESDEFPSGHHAASLCEHLESRHDLGSRHQDDCSQRRSDLGGRNLAGPRLNPQERHRVSPSSRVASRSPDGRAPRVVSHQEKEEHQAEHPPHLRQESEGRRGFSQRHGNSTSEYVHAGDVCPVCWFAVQASEHHDGCPARRDDLPRQLPRRFAETCPEHLLGLQDLFAVVGCCCSRQIQLRDQRCQSPRQRALDHLGNENEDVSKPTVSRDGLHNSSGNVQFRYDESTQARNPKVEESRNLLSKINSTNAEVDEERQGNSKSHLPLDQANRDQPAHGIRDEGRARLPSHPVDGQASRQDHQSLSILNNSLHQQQSGSRQDVENSRRYQTLGQHQSLDSSSPTDSFLQELHRQNNFFGEYDFDITNNNSKNKNVSSSSSFSSSLANSRQDRIYIKNYFLKSNNNNNNNNSASFLRRHHDSKVARGDDRYNIKFHSSPVSELDVQKILDIMSDTQRKRFEEIFNSLLEQIQFRITNDPEFSFENLELYNQHARRLSSLLPEHAKQLVNDGLASLVSPSDKSSSPSSNSKSILAIPFTVIEQKEDGPRQRFILWTQLLNDIISKSYVPKMSHLKHSNYYVDAVRDEAAAIGDLKISFFQVAIPEWFRRLLRFCDDDGQLYEFLRLPMGFRPSAEIMQLLVETLSGMPHACKPSVTINNELIQLSSNRVSTSVWIDGFRCAGPLGECLHAAERIKKIGAHCGVTWKGAGVEVSQRYNFIGIDFNHATHTVQVAEKTLSKVPTFYSRSAPVQGYAT